MSFPLATVDDLRKSLGGHDSESLRLILYSNLKSATFQLQTIFGIGNNFRETVGAVDTFLVDQDTGNKRDRFMKFRLNQTFMNDDTTPFDIRFGLTEEDLDDTNPVDPVFLKIDKERGYVDFDLHEFQDSLISINRLRLPRNFTRWLFRITYDHGLPTKGTDEGKIFNQKNVPEWLQEAAMIKGREIYHLANPSKDVDAAQIAGNLEYLLAAHGRRGGIRRMTPIIET